MHAIAVDLLGHLHGPSRIAHYTLKQMPARNTKANAASTAAVLVAVGLAALAVGAEAVKFVSCTVGCATSTDAEKACHADALVLCSQAQVVGTSHCQAGWVTGGAKGYWMDSYVDGGACGQKGWNDWLDPVSGAYCCAAPTLAPTAAPTVVVSTCEGQCSGTAEECKKRCAGIWSHSFAATKPAAPAAGTPGSTQTKSRVALGAACVATGVVVAALGLAVLRGGDGGDGGGGGGGVEGRV